MSDSGTPRSGARMRSVSESETDRISSAVLVLDSNKSPILNPQLDIELTRSSLNISPPGSGLIETPLGVGLGTHFQVRNSPLLLERKSKAERDFNNLRKEIEQWIILMKASPPPDLLVVLEGYERFKRRISALYFSALWFASTNANFKKESRKAQSSCIK